MDDRKLLERAAKAAGINLRFLGGETPFSDGPDFVGEWNPLTDDGDCFRLAAKLRIRHFFSEDEVTALNDDHRATVAIWLSDDDARDLRKAIVRVAASMCPEE